MKIPNWASAGICFAVLVVIGCCIGWHYRDSAYEGVFAVINALFSGLAFVGLIIAIFMQREELELQRQELRDTRAEFKQQNESLKQQNDTQKHQRFETTFFNLLEVFHGCQDELTFKDYTEMWEDLKKRLFDQVPKEENTDGRNGYRVGWAKEFRKD